MAESAESEELLYIRLFGPVHVEVRGQPIGALRTRRGYWLLALLTLRANREVSRLWLAGCLWPDSDDTTGLSNLRRTLTDLRSALGPASARIEAPTTNSLLLRLARQEADVLAFDAALLQNTSESLEQAITLYTGPLLEGCDELWAAQEQEPRRVAYYHALERLGDIKRQRGYTAEAIRCYRLTLAGDPWRESLNSHLMQTLAENGDRASAAEVYRALRLALRRETNSDPTPELTALYRQILHDTGRRPPPVLASAVSAPAIASSPSSSGSIPGMLTPLIGRESEVEAILNCLETSKLVTLIGTGGIGKTRLSIQVATELAGCYDDGIRFVELAALNDPALLPKAVASALGLVEESERPLLETARIYLRSRSLLLILDNCEHLLDACAQFVGSLVSACPDLRILATSRQPLGLTGEISWRVPPLTLPSDKFPLALAPADIPDLVARYAALRLFYERARAIQSGFHLTPQSVPAAIAICKRLDGIPLAIELAAVRVKSLSLDQIVTRLEDRFRLLTGGSRNVLPRQQTLRAAIDWSYDLLEPMERLMLRRLSVFQGGWILQSAQEVCADAPGAEGTTEYSPIESWEALDLLDRLVDKSLVMTEISGEDEVRYRLLDTIHQYARMKLEEAGEVEALAARHQDWCLRLTSDAEKEMQGARQIFWVNQLEREHDNIRGALEWCKSHAADSEAKAIAELKLVASLWRFWMTRGYLREGLNWLLHSLDTTQALEQSSELQALRLKALYGAGGLAWQLSDLARARELMQECLPLVLETGDRVRYASVLNGLGVLVYSQGDNEAARRYWEESLAIWREFGERRALTGSLNNLGYVMHRLNDFDRAREYHTEALAIATEEGNRESQSASRTGLGNIAKSQGDYPLARSNYEQNLQHARELGNKDEMAGMLNNLGLVLTWEKQYGEATEALLESLAISEETGGIRGMAEVITNLVDVAASSNTMERAARLLGIAEKLHLESGNALIPNERLALVAGKQRIRLALGEARFEVYYSEGQEMSLEQALDYARQAA